MTATPPSAPPAPLPEPQASRLLHELQVHQEELALQNEALQEARAALERSVQRFADHHESAPVGLVTVTRQAVVLEANRCSRDLLGCGPAGLVGNKLLDRLTEASRDTLWRAIAATDGAPGSRLLEVTALRPPGADGLAGSADGLRLEVRIKPVGDNNLVLVLTDLTERRAAEADLAHTREILDLSNRIARIGWWALDPASGQLSWSAMALEIHGLDPSAAAQLATVDAALLRVVAGDSRDRLRAALAAAQQRGTAFDLELQITSAAGQALWVRQIGIADLVGGRCQRLYGTFQDIDARIQADAARLAQLRAELANQAKSAFLARMSHDLRTPLHAVLGFAQLLSRNPVVLQSATASRQAQHIFEAGRHLLAMIDDVLDLARIESGALRLEAEPVQIEALVSECLSLNAAAAAKNQVVLQVLNAAPGQAVLGDRTRLRQVLLNLLSNAVKYNRAGGRVEISCAVRGQQLALAVRDTGLGLTPAQLACLFQPFNRLGAQHSGIKGTGLGLVIARQLVEAMGGMLSVQSTPGSGSVFTAWLTRAQPAAAAAGSSLPAPAAADLPAASVLRPLTVLYVENDLVNAEVMHYAIGCLDGVTLEVANDGLAGLAAARRLQPDLLLLDLDLPQLDGMALRQQLAADPALAKIPCVALSAHALEPDISRAHEAGFTDFLTKPFMLDRLLNLVQALRH